MKAILAAIVICFCACAEVPRYNESGELIRPENYREWIYLSSGLGMTYGPAAASASGTKFFDNVFVEPSAWNAFKQTGKWPDKTMFVLEIRHSQSEGSINKGGHFQTGVNAFEMAVKDTAKSPQDKWAYFSFATENGRSAASAKPLPRTASCLACHTANGAVENTFTQFYPTALEIARQKGTLKPTYRASNVP